MLPPNKLNPFEQQPVLEDEAGRSLKDQIVELQARNLYLQTLIVELLDKNEQLRHKVAETLSQ